MPVMGTKKKIQYMTENSTSGTRLENQTINSFSCTEFPEAKQEVPRVDKLWEGVGGGTVTGCS